MQSQKGNVNIIITLIVVACIIGLIVWGLMQKASNTPPQESLGDNSGQTQNTNNQEIQNQTNVSPQKQMEKPQRLLVNFTPVAKVSELKTIDQVVGTGAAVKPGDTVSVHYTGALAATGVVFQSSKDFGPTPITFPLSGVIKGWTDGIPGMKVGGTRRLLIPATQAYGATPPPGSGIPANADLVFDVELIAIK